MTDSRYNVRDLLRVMQRLRDPHTGCPWDIQQDFSSIVPSTLEECYELAQAIESADYPHVAEELGDVLFQVVFYSQLGAEQDLFDFGSVVDTLVEKLLRRHPHVFADGDIEGVVSQEATIESVQQSWEAIKQGEREGKQQSGVLADVPVALPALPRAQKLQKRAARVRFDWDDAAGVLSKLEEEIAELREAMAGGGQSSVAEEVGDVLFTCVNLARHLQLDAETALRHASTKFESRFATMERRAGEQGHEISELSRDQLESLWQEAKSRDTDRS